MTFAERLRELLGKATRGPVTAELDRINKPARLQETVCAAGYGIARYTIYSTEEDVLLDAYLRNNAEAIAELVEAAERLRDAFRSGRASKLVRREHDAVDALDAALSSLHPDTQKDET